MAIRTNTRNLLDNPPIPVQGDLVVEEFSLDGFGGPRYKLGQDRLEQLTTKPAGVRPGG